MDETSVGVALYVKDLAGMSTFYRGLLDLEVREAGRDFAVLARGAIEVILVAMAPEWAQAVVITRPPVIREETPIKPLFPVQDIARVRVAADALGGRLKEPEREWTFHTYRVCDGYDPEGNVFQVRQAA